MVRGYTVKIFKVNMVTLLHNCHKDDFYLKGLGLVYLL